MTEFLDRSTISQNSAVLEKGVFSKIFLANSKNGRETFAMKVMEKNSLETLQKASDELKVI